MLPDQDSLNSTTTPAKDNLDQIPDIEVWLDEPIALAQESEPNAEAKPRTPKKIEPKLLYLCFVASFVGTYNSFLIQSISQGDNSP